MPSQTASCPNSGPSDTPSSSLFGVLIPPSPAWVVLHGMEVKLLILGAEVSWTLRLQTPPGRPRQPAGLVTAGSWSDSVSMHFRQRQWPGLLEPPYLIVGNLGAESSSGPLSPAVWCRFQVSRILQASWEGTSMAVAAMPEHIPWWNLQQKSVSNPALPDALFCFINPVSE